MRRSGGSLLLVFTLLITLAPVADVNAGDWGPVGQVTTTTDANMWAGSIGAFGSAVHVVYRQLDADGRIVQYRRSSDGGTTWDAPVEVSRPSATESARSTLAVYGSTLDVVWVEGDLLTGPTTLFYRRSTNAGGSWSDPVAISPTATNLVGYPVITRAGSTVVIAYTDWETGQIFVHRSTDGGATWRGRVAVGTSDQDAGDNLFEAEPDLAFGSGVLYAVWKASETKVMLRRSLDAGATWAATTTLETKASYSVSVAAVGSSAMVVYQFYDGTSNSYVAQRTTTDKGVHWTARARISSGAEPARPGDLIRAGGKWRHVYRQCFAGGCDSGSALWYRDSVDGRSWSTASRFNNLEREEQYGVSTAYSSNTGRYLVAWAGFELGASEGDIFVRSLLGQAKFWSGPIGRLSGPDRFATAVAISKATFKTPPVPVAYVATGLNFPDALAGGPAATLEGGPVLLVRPDSIPDVVKAELTRLKPARIKVLGGPSVVSSAVESALKGYTTGAVTRLAGADRYATAAQVVGSVFGGYKGRVYVAFGGNFPDALSGGAAAAKVGAPIILAQTSDVPDSIVAALGKLTPTTFVLLGGSGVLGAGVVNELKARFPGVPIGRWSGADRYATSAAIAAQAFPDGADTVYLATGLNFPDALSGVPAAGLAGAPLLLTRQNCLPPVVATQLLALDPAWVVILGGASVVASTAPTTVCGTAP